MAHSPTVVVRVVKVVTPGPAVEEAAVGGVERKVVPGVALHRLPLPQRREAHQGDEVRAHQSGARADAGRPGTMFSERARSITPKTRKYANRVARRVCGNGRIAR